MGLASRLTGVSSRWEKTGAEKRRPAQREQNHPRPQAERCRPQSSGEAQWLPSPAAEVPEGSTVEPEQVDRARFPQPQSQHLKPSSGTAGVLESRVQDAVPRPSCKVSLPPVRPAFPTGSVSVSARPLHTLGWGS